MHNSFGAQFKMAGPEQRQQGGTVNQARIFWGGAGGGGCTQFLAPLQRCLAPPQKVSAPP